MSHFGRLMLTVGLSLILGFSVLLSGIMAALFGPAAAVVMFVVCLGAMFAGACLAIDGDDG